MKNKNKNKYIDERRRYELLFARSEMLEKCRYCEPDQACCTGDCEIFERVVEAIEYELCDINPCFYCPLSRTSCFGWDSGRPNPFPVNDKKEETKERTEVTPLNALELRERIDSFPKKESKTKGEGKVVMAANFSDTKSMDVDEVWLLSTQKIKIKRVNQVIDVRDTETLKIKLALLYQKVKNGTTVALVPKSEKLGAVLEKHGLVVEYFSAEKAVSGSLRKEVIM